MYILVKKFSLRHNNVVYAAGSIVELPDDVAQKLHDDAPEEFEIIGEPEAEAAAPEEVASVSEPAAKPASGKKSKKQPACDDEDALPAVDEAATVQ